MRRLTAMTLTTMISALALASGAAIGQGNPPADPPSRVTGVADAPRIELDRAEHDFGIITDDKKLRTDVVFRNMGKGTLVITNIETTCGCTTPELAKREYAPGESGEIVIYYDPHNRSGLQNRTVTILSNDPDRPRMPITIKANVKKMVDISPAIVRMGQVPKGESRTMMVDVTSRLPGFRIQGVEVMRVDGLTFELLDQQPVEEADGDKAIRQTILLTLATNTKIGPIQGALSIRIADADGTITEKNLSVLGEVMGDLELKPQQINVGSVKPGMTVERHVSITSREKRPFKILRVAEVPLKGIDDQPRDPQLDEITFEAVPADAETMDRQMLRFSFKPREEVVRQFFTQLVVYTDREDQPELTLRILGRIDGPALVTPAAPVGAAGG